MQKRCAPSLSPDQILGLGENLRLTHAGHEIRDRSGARVAHTWVQRSPL